jgi:hypothetical protein
VILDLENVTGSDPAVVDKYSASDVPDTSDTGRVLDDGCQGHCKEAGAGDPSKDEMRNKELRRDEEPHNLSREECKMLIRSLFYTVQFLNLTFW